MRDYEHDSKGLQGLDFLSTNLKIQIEKNLRDKRHTYLEERQRGNTKRQLRRKRSER